MRFVESQEVKFGGGCDRGRIDLELSTVLKERHSNFVISGQSKPAVHLVQHGRSSFPKVLIGKSVLWEGRTEQEWFRP